MKSILWLRDDLRLHDNRPLAEWAAASTSGLIVWCVTPSFDRAGPIRRNFILQSLRRFKLDAERLGATVLTFDRPASERLGMIARSYGAHRIFGSSLPTFEEANEEKALATELGDRLLIDPQTSLLHPSELPCSIAQLPEIFTVFRKRVEARLAIRPEALTPTALPNGGTYATPYPTWNLEAEPQLPSHANIAPGEPAGLARLDSYLWQSDCVQTYKETRNGLLDWNDSSKLSPYLSVGALSPRRIYFELKRYEQERVKNDSTYWLFFELLWRDYFKFIAQKWGAKLFTGMKTPSAARIFDADVAAWCQGETGDRFVDANMHELNTTGWMSNRGRQNVASYLTKTMRADWRLGASYFEKMLIDYDAASNWGNWAYLAGTGQDGRDRAFSTERQAALYDPDGAYRDRWHPKQ